MSCTTLCTRYGSAISQLESSPKYVGSGCIVRLGRETTVPFSLYNLNTKRFIFFQQYFMTL